MPSNKYTRDYEDWTGQPLKNKMLPMHFQNSLAYDGFGGLQWMVQNMVSAFGPRHLIEGLTPSGTVGSITIAAGYAMIDGKIYYNAGTSGELLTDTQVLQLDADGQGYTVKASIDACDGFPIALNRDDGTLVDIRARTEFGNRLITGDTEFTHSVEIGGGYGNTGITMSATGNISANGNLVIDGTGSFGGAVTMNDFKITDIEDGTVAENGEDAITGGQLWSHKELTGTSAHGAVTAATSNQIVTRGTSGEFAAGAITSTGFAGPLVGDVTGNADTATKLAATKKIGNVNFDGSVNIVPQTIQVTDESSDTLCYIAYFTTTIGDLYPKTGDNLKFNSSNGTVTATIFAGALSGNATTSSSCSGNALTSGSFSSIREIALTGDVTGAVSETGESGWSIATTVVPANHTHTHPASTGTSHTYISQNVTGTGTPTFTSVGVAGGSLSTASSDLKVESTSNNILINATASNKGITLNADAGVHMYPDSGNDQLRVVVSGSDIEVEAYGIGNKNLSLISDGTYMKFTV